MNQPDTNQDTSDEKRQGLDIRMITINALISSKSVKDFINLNESI